MINHSKQKPRKLSPEERRRVIFAYMTAQSKKEQEAFSEIAKFFLQF